MGIIKDYSIKIRYSATKEYPRMGKFVALIQVPHANDKLTYELCPRESIMEDMEGVFLGYVASILPKKRDVEIVVRVCRGVSKLDSDEGSRKTEEFVFNADNAVVLDVMFGNSYEKGEFNFEQMGIAGLYDWICNTNTFSGISLNLMDETSIEITKKYFELCGHDFAKSFLDGINLDDSRIGESSERLEEKKRPPEKLTTENLNNLKKYLERGLPLARKSDYNYNKTCISDIDYFLELYPYIMHDGISYKIAIYSDHIFKSVNDENKIYLSPFAREFLISCAYLGCEITIITYDIEVCKELLNASDVPYHKIQGMSVDLYYFDFNVLNNTEFNGFVFLFHQMYNLSLLNFRSMISDTMTYDGIRDIINTLYRSNFQYSAMFLSEIIHYINTIKN